jgi:1,2-diacylglycerol 3-beta-glucosyltransferase
MLGRPYTWVKTSRAGTTSTIRPAAVAPADETRPAAGAAVTAATPARPRTFALTAPGTQVTER